ncbi:hypothetical protein ACSSS7_003137 [Eimeria intestinalis]
MTQRGDLRLESSLLSQVSPWFTLIRSPGSEAAHRQNSVTNRRTCCPELFAPAQEPLEVEFGSHDRNACKRPPAVAAVGAAGAAAVPVTVVAARKREPASRLPASVVAAGVAADTLQQRQGSLGASCEVQSDAELLQQMQQQLQRQPSMQGLLLRSSAPAAGTFLQRT